MAILSNDKTRLYRASHPENDVALPLAGYTNFAGGNATHIVYKGSVVVCDVSDTDGYFRACPLSSSTNLASGDIFGGIAREHVEVGTADLADGAKYVRVARDGVFAFAKGSIAQTDVGAPAYASDDDTITTTSTNNIWVGTIVGVDADYVWVEINRAAGQPNSVT